MKTSLPRTPRRRGGLRVRRAGALLLPLLAGAACSEPEPVQMAELVRQDGAYLHPVTLEPYSGPVFASYQGEPQHVERRASLRDGHFDGPFELYYANRKLSLREVYREGQKDGPYEWYFEDGRLYERGTYQDGLREGPYEAYFGDGHLWEKGTYRYGDFHGPREWYLGERLLERVTYVNGQIDGRYERYSPEGELLLQGTLRYGNPCGTWIAGSERVAYPTCGYESE